MHLSWTFLFTEGAQTALDRSQMTGSAKGLAFQVHEDTGERI